MFKGVISNREDGSGCHLFFDKTTPQVGFVGGSVFDNKARHDNQK